MEIEGSELLHTPYDLNRDEDNEKKIDRGDDEEDVTVELFTLVVTEVNKVDSSKEYKFLEDEIIYNEE